MSKKHHTPNTSEQTQTEPALPSTDLNTASSPSGLNNLAESETSAFPTDAALQANPDLAIESDSAIQEWFQTQIADPINAQEGSEELRRTWPSILEKMRPNDHNPYFWITYYWLFITSILGNLKFYDEPSTITPPKIERKLNSTDLSTPQKIQQFYEKSLLPQTLTAPGTPKIKTILFQLLNALNEKQQDKILNTIIPEFIKSGLISLAIDPDGNDLDENQILQSHNFIAILSPESPIFKNFISQVQKYDLPDKRLTQALESIRTLIITPNIHDSKQQSAGITTKQDIVLAKPKSLINFLGTLIHEGTHALQNRQNSNRPRLISESEAFTNQALLYTNYLKTIKANNEENPEIESELRSIQDQLSIAAKLKSHSNFPQLLKLYPKSLNAAELIKHLNKDEITNLTTLHDPDSNFHNNLQAAIKIALEKFAIPDTKTLIQTLITKYIDPAQKDLKNPKLNLLAHHAIKLIEYITGAEFQSTPTNQTPIGQIQTTKITTKENPSSKPTKTDPPKIELPQLQPKQIENIKKIATQFQKFGRLSATLKKPEENSFKTPISPQKFNQLPKLPSDQAKEHPTPSLPKKLDSPEPTPLLDYNNLTKGLDITKPNSLLTKDSQLIIKAQFTIRTQDTYQPIILSQSDLDRALIRHKFEQGIKIQFADALSGKINSDFQELMQHLKTYQNISFEVNFEKPGMPQEIKDAFVLTQSNGINNLIQYLKTSSYKFVFAVHKTHRQEVLPITLALLKEQSLKKFTGTHSRQIIGLFLIQNTDSPQALEFIRSIYAPKDLPHSIKLYDDLPSGTFTLGPLDGLEMLKQQLEVLKSWSYKTTHSHQTDQQTLTIIIDLFKSTGLLPYFLSTCSPTSKEMIMEVIKKMYQQNGRHFDATKKPSITIGNNIADIQDQIDEIMLIANNILQNIAISDDASPLNIYSDEFPSIHHPSKYLNQINFTLEDLIQTAKLPKSQALKIIFDKNKLLPYISPSDTLFEPEKVTENVKNIIYPFKNDEDVLKKIIKLYANSDDTRTDFILNKAIKLIPAKESNNSFFLQIAKQGKYRSIVIETMKKVTDQQTLKNLVQQELYDHRIHYFTFCAAKQIQDQEYLKKILNDPKANKMIQEAALTQITDPNVLQQFAQTTNSKDLRKFAIELLDKSSPQPKH